MHEETRRNERADEAIRRRGQRPVGGEEHRGDGGYPPSLSLIRRLLQVTVFLAVAAFEAVLGLAIFFQVSGYAGAPESLVLLAPLVALGAVVSLAFLSIL